MPESRLDRIERLNEETARQTAENAKAIAQLTEQHKLLVADMATTNIELRASHLMVDQKFKEMAEAQTAMLKTLDRLAKLWERSPN